MTYLSILRSIAAALCTTLLLATSHAEPYPSRPIRIVVGYTAGEELTRRRGSTPRSFRRFSTRR